MGTKINLTGKRFGKLVALEYFGNGHWMTQCDCGTKKAVKTSHLISGNTKSCGCLKTGRKVVHGKSHTKIHKIWTSILTRCHNPNSTRYSYFGGMGITVCERWCNSFENFLDDMGEPPKGLVLGRIDKNKEYSPENCRWETPQEASLNRIRDKRNKSGYRGISLNKKTNKWSAQIAYNKKVIFHKTFRTLKEAVLARNKFIIGNNLPHPLNNWEE